MNYKFSFIYLSLMLLFFSGIYVKAQPQKEIAFVSKTSVVDENSVLADKPFIDDLLSQGYKIDTLYTTALETSDSLINVLNSADLVIIGRSGGSGDFGGTHKAAWNNITTPVLLLHPWAARNNRLNWLPTGTTTSFDTGGDTISAKIEMPDDTVFSDVTLAADSTMDWVTTPYDYLGTTNGGNGTVLARSASDGNVFFVRWDPWVEFYNGAGDGAAGYRTLIGNGNDHANATNGDPFNYYNFTPAAKQVYLNEVERMLNLPAPPPKPVGFGKEIAFVSKTSVVDENGVQADKPFIDDLLTEGYKVNTLYTTALETSDSLINVLNSADLVIIGRSGGSGDFGGAHKAAWNAITSPVMLLHPWAARNNRLNWLATGTTTSFDTGGDTVSAKIEVPDDTVFTGVTIAADSTMDWVTTPYDYMETTSGGNGTVLAREAVSSNVLFVRWDPWVKFYNGASDYAAGYRTLIGNGNDHANATNGDPFNYYNFTPAAKQVYLNEVERMANLPAPPPKPAGLGKTIAFVSFPDKIDPATNENADQPFIDDLIADEYTVNTYYSSSLETDSALVDTLNSVDLVIIGRSGSSGDFGDQHKAAWNNITSPVLLLHLWAARSNRLNWLLTGTTTQYNTTGDTISAKIEAPDDPVFADATIAADSTMDWIISPYDYMATTDGGNGTVLAREATSSNVLFVRWDPWVEFYSGAGDMAAGYRTLIGNGNDAAGSFNYYNFTTEAKQVYLNEVERMASLGKVERPVKKVAYVTNAAKQADLVDGAAPVNDDPIIRMLNADDKFEVDVLAVAPDSSVDLSGYDVVVAQESFNSSSAIFMPGGSLGFASISVPFLYNKVYAMRDGRGFQGGATGSGGEIEGTYTIDVDPANQGNDLFKGLTFENNQLTLFSTGADDNGGNTRTKALNFATDVVISDTTTLLGIETGAPANATVGINDVPAGTQFGSETLKARMITVGFNFGALVSNDGNNLTSAGLTIWRNAVYSLAGLEVPSEPVVIVGVNSETKGLPTVYALEQNYPNPFNPTTTIKFTLPKNSNVKLAVYDILGRLVTKLVDGNLTAGYHTVQFNASNLASGVYFYRIEAGNFVQVKKLMLLK